MLNLQFIIASSELIIAKLIKLPIIKRHILWLLYCLGLFFSNSKQFLIVLNSCARISTNFNN